MQKIKTRQWCEKWAGKLQKLFPHARWLVEPENALAVADALSGIPEMVRVLTLPPTESCASNFLCRCSIISGYDLAQLANDDEITRFLKDNCASLANWDIPK
jgi:hypothetical protein